MIADEIEKLMRLRDSGALSEAEFQQAKQRLLGSGTQSAGNTSPFAYVPVEGSTGKICGLDVKLYIALMHGLQLISWTGLGVVAPIVMWVLGRDESRDVDRHGRIIVNWMISSLIYLGVSSILLFVLIGWPMLLVLGALWIIFPVIGTFKALDGKAWKYPLSIEFFAVEMTET